MTAWLIPPLPWPLLLSLTLAPDTLSNWFAACFNIEGLEPTYRPQLFNSTRAERGNDDPIFIHYPGGLLVSRVGPPYYPKGQLGQAIYYGNHQAVLFNSVEHHN